MTANNTSNISFTVNGEKFNNVNVPSRQHLADYLRSQGLTGTHLGCEQGACGACTLYNDAKVVFIDVNGRCLQDRRLKGPDNPFK